MAGRRVRVSWRHKGGRKPPSVAYVGRGSRWGNPHLVSEGGKLRPCPKCGGALHDRTQAVWLFAEYAVARLAAEPGWLAPLPGRDLACYCAPGEACHADVLPG